MTLILEFCRAVTAHVARLVGRRKRRRVLTRFGEGKWVNHKDGDPLNNEISNLEIKSGGNPK